MEVYDGLASLLKQANQAVEKAAVHTKIIA